MSSWDGPIVNESYNLNDAQIVKLLAMTECLREGFGVLETVLCIKQSEDEWDARGLWESLEEADQTALWIAPRYGGIFTTDERKALRPT